MTKDFEIGTVEIVGCHNNKMPFIHTVGLYETKIELI